MNRWAAAGALSLVLMFTLSVCASSAMALPVTFDPNIAGQGTTLLVDLDQSALSAGGTSARSTTFALERGMRFDRAAVEQLCDRAAAARSACPLSSRIGFGRFVATVRGYDFGGGVADLAWSIDAYLGKPLRRRDAASVVLTANLLGASSVTALLAPALGTSVPSRVTTVGRLVSRKSSRYGIELSFPNLPVRMDVAAPITVTPTGLELALSAVRRVRQNFTHRIKVRTPSGYEVRKIPDHRLIGHNLLETPSQCKASWAVQLSVGFGSTVKRTTTRIGCAKPGADVASTTVRAGRGLFLERHDPVALGEQPSDVGRCDPASCDLGEVIVSRPTGNRATLSDIDGDRVVAELRE